MSEQKYEGSDYTVTEILRYNPIGFNNFLDWYAKCVLYLKTSDDIFEQEFAWCVADPNCHMPRTPMEWDRWHQMVEDIQ